MDGQNVSTIILNSNIFEQLEDEQILCIRINTVKMSIEKNQHRMMVQRFRSMITYLKSIPSPSGLMNDLTSTSVEFSSWMKSRPLLLGEYLTI